jgi:hypothetical protein
MSDRKSAERAIEALRNPDPSLAHVVNTVRQSLAEVVEDQQNRIEELEAALQRIVQWSEAYPLDIFPEPDWKKARSLLEAGGITLDAVSAHCMRHVIEGVGKIAGAALDKDAGK